MVQKVTITVADDIDGSEVAETLPTTFANVAYEIDLSEEYAKEFPGTLGRYAAGGRKVQPALRKPAQRGH